MNTGSLSDAQSISGILGTVINPITNGCKITEIAPSGQSYLMVTNTTGLSGGDIIIIADMTAHGAYRIINREVATVLSTVNGNRINLTAPLTQTHVIYPHQDSWITKQTYNVQNYYDFQNSSFTNIALDSVNLVLEGRFTTDFIAGYDSSLYTGPAVNSSVVVYLDVGSGWQSVGTLTWSYSEKNFICKSINVTSIITDITKLNYCRMKLEGIYDWTSTLEICEAYLDFNGGQFQESGDYFKIDMGSIKSRVSGIYVECRGEGGTEKYARNYEIQTATVDGVWTSRASQSNNKCRDIIESWSPVSARYIQIRLTANANTGWQISQVYIYQSDDLKYCIWNEGSGSTLGPYLSGNFYADNYVNIIGSPISPINLPQGRLIDSIQDIISKMHEDDYAIWEWWIDFRNGDFYIGDEKGSDKSNSIIFQTNTHIGEVSHSVDIRTATSRVKVVGKSESKKADEVSSSWQIGGTGYTDNETALGTFYENVISSKRVSKKETADIVANIEARMNGKPSETLEIPITNDEYAPMAYDYGDTVTIIDANTGIDSSNICRINSIKKHITESGEEITLFVKTRYKDMTDEWAKVRKQIRELGLGTNSIEDWLADGAEQDKIDSNKVSDSWDKSAKNDEAFAPKDIDDRAWVKSGVSLYSQDLVVYDQWFYLYGSKVADGATKTVKAYVVDVDSVVEGSTSPSITFEQNPKFTCDFKIYKKGTNPNTGSTDWRDGDNLFIGMSNSDNSAYFAFIVIRYQSQYLLYVAVKKSSGSPTSIWAVKDIYENQVSIQTGVKYRIDAKVDWDTQLIKYSFNNKLVAILPIDSTFQNETLYPMYVHLQTSNPNPVTYWACAFIYKLRSEWEFST